MNIYEFLFIMQLVLIIGIILTKLYNIMSSYTTRKPIYDIRIGFILFITFFIAYGVSMTVFMLNPEILLYLQIFRFETWFITLNVLFMIIEIIMHVGLTAERPIQPYLSNQVKKLE